MSGTSPARDLALCEVCLQPSNATSQGKCVRSKRYRAADICFVANSVRRAATMPACWSSCWRWMMEGLPRPKPYATSVQQLSSVIIGEFSELELAPLRHTSKSAAAESLSLKPQNAEREAQESALSRILVCHRPAVLIRHNSSTNETAHGCHRGGSSGCGRGRRSRTIRADSRR